MIEETELQKIAEFFLKYSRYDTDLETVKKYIQIHFDHKTAFVIKDGEDIVAVCRWNIDDPKVAEILDLYIREDFRGKKIIQIMLERGLWLFPTVKAIKFERQKKYPGREYRTIPVEKILKRS